VERRLRAFKNRVLRRIFGPKRDEVIGEWRRLRNEEIHTLYFYQISFVYEIMSKNMAELEGPQMTSQYGAYELHAG
jgi:hypothetical protein